MIRVIAAATLVLCLSQCHFLSLATITFQCRKGAVKVSDQSYQLVTASEMKNCPFMVRTGFVNSHFISTFSPRNCYRVNHRSYLGVLKVRLKKISGEVDLRCVYILSIDYDHTAWSSCCVSVLGDSKHRV